MSAEDLHERVPKGLDISLMKYVWLKKILKVKTSACFSSTDY